jgi:hypothetical protein
MTLHLNVVLIKSPNMKITVVKVKRQLHQMASLKFIFGSNPKEEILPDCPPTKRESKLNNLCMIHDLFYMTMHFYIFPLN